MARKEIIALLLAGGQGSRLGVLTKNIAKPAVLYGGKYRIIDFTLSNCINSNIDTVGVLTQYQPLKLHSHIGIGKPWDLDRMNGGVTILTPYQRFEKGEWYSELLMPCSRISAMSKNSLPNMSSFCPAITSTK